MSRNVIKSISRMPEKFIPSTHRNDPSLKEDNADILDRPLIFYVRKLTRDEQFKVRELLEYKDDLHPEKGSKGLGDVLKFIWENNVTEVRNVVIYEGGQVVKHEGLAGAAKDALWNTEGMDVEINEAILFARGISSLEEAEVKN
jgi:hypothetical protein